MKLTAPFIWLVVAVGVAEAAFPHAGRSDVHARHARLSQRHEVDSNLSRRVQPNQKRCKQRPSSSSLDASSTNAPATTPAKSINPPENAAAKPTTSKAATKAATTTKAAAPPAATKAASSSNSGSSGNLLQLSFPQCGANGATSNITPTTGPNGAEYFLNCGIDGSGWTPPPITVQDVIAMDLNTALADPNSPFKNCAAYVSLFEQYGGQYNVPPIFLASIAMQESSCDPNKTGGAGEQGLMQITKDKCGAAPNGNCKEPWYNIMTGADFFSGLISSNGGNLLKAIGEYNGWVEGLTIAKATAAAGTSCCTCQNNLDYLTQFLNGWLQNRDPSASPRIGQYFNLDQCNR